MPAGPLTKRLLTKLQLHHRLVRPGEQARAWLWAGLAGPAQWQCRRAGGLHPTFADRLAACPLAGTSGGGAQGPGQASGRLCGAAARPQHHWCEPGWAGLLWSDGAACNSAACRCDCCGLRCLVLPAAAATGRPCRRHLPLTPCSLNSTRPFNRASCEPRGELCAGARRGGLHLPAQVPDQLQVGRGWRAGAGARSVPMPVADDPDAARQPSAGSASRWLQSPHARSCTPTILRCSVSKLPGKEEKDHEIMLQVGYS